MKKFKRMQDNVSYLRKLLGELDREKMVVDKKGDIYYFLDLSLIEPKLSYAERRRLKTTKNKQKQINKRGPKTKLKSMNYQLFLIGANDI